LAWLTQPFVKSNLINSLDQGKTRAELVKQLLGATVSETPVGTLIWLHAQTLSEAQSFGEIVAHFESRKDIQFLWTTEEDNIDSELKMPGMHLHLPLDYPTFVAKFLENWKPDALVWLSDSIRPILMQQIAKMEIPSVYANAGLSRAKAQKYIWFPNYIGAYLSSFDRILAKSDESAKRLRRANAPRTKLEVLGVMQAGARALPHDERERARFAAHLKNRPVWLAAHVSPAEIAALGKTQRRVSRVAQGLLLILQMDEKSQATTAASKLSALGLRVQMHTNKSHPAEDADVLIAYGDAQLGMLFRLAPVCFLGHSLDRSGGADPLEPAALGSAILHGPYTNNYQSAFDRLSDAGGARLVYNSEMLSEALAETLSPDRAAEMAHAAWEVCSAGAEVNDRVIELLDGYLSLEESNDAST
jgi:3-deoxy-D-manno-octulosonic-acid transferase